MIFLDKLIYLATQSERKINIYRSLSFSIWLLSIFKSVSKNLAKCSFSLIFSFVFIVSFRIWRWNYKYYNLRHALISSLLVAHGANVHICFKFSANITVTLLIRQSMFQKFLNTFTAFDSWSHPYMIFQFSIILSVLKINKHIFGWVIFKNYLIFLCNLYLNTFNFNSSLKSVSESWEWELLN